MKLSAPKKWTWVVALVLGVLGLLGTFAAIPVVSAHAFWFVFVAFAILVFATSVKGL
jgi:hypothetical protein